MRTLAKAALEGAAFGAAIILTIFLSYTVLTILYPAPEREEYSYDSTDNTPAQSGLEIREDFYTKCQYLVELKHGGLSARLNANGEPMCGEQK